MRLARPIGIITFSLAALGLAACGGDADTGATPDPATEMPDTETEAPDSPEPEAQGGDECLQGDWEGDLRIAERELGTLEVGDVEVAPEVESSGTTIVSFANGTMTTEYDDQTTTVTFALDEAQDVTATATLNGTTEGTYAIEGDTLTVTEIDISGLTADLTAELAGEEYELPGLEQVQDTFAADASFTYECADDTLRLVPETEQLPDEELEDEVDEDALEIVLTRR